MFCIHKAMDNDGAGGSGGEDPSFEELRLNILATLSENASILQSASKELEVELGIVSVDSLILLRQFYKELKSAPAIVVPCERVVTRSESRALCVKHFREVVALSGLSEDNRIALTYILEQLP